MDDRPRLQPQGGQARKGEARERVASEAGEIASCPSWPSLELAVDRVSFVAFLDDLSNCGCKLVLEQLHEVSSIDPGIRLAF